MILSATSPNTHIMFAYSQKNEQFLGEAFCNENLIVLNTKDKNDKSKEKYVDDGSTIVDMSALDNYGFRAGGSKSTFKEKFKTYIDTVKLMIIPMLVTIGIICVAFGLLYLMFELAA